MRRSYVFLFILLLIVALAASCAKKDESGGNDDDSDDDVDDDAGDDTDDDSDDDTGLDDGVTEYSVLVNMTEVPLADFEVQVFDLYTAGGLAEDVPGIPVQTVLSSLSSFAADAPDYLYDFVANDDVRLLDGLADESELPDWADLSKAVFYDNADSGGDLAVGWTDESLVGYAFDFLDGGRIVTFPGPAVEPSPIAYVNEWDDLAGAPVHEGETVTLRAVATVGTNVIVAGTQYVKFYLQDETDGVYVFADTEQSGDYDGPSMTDVNVFAGMEVLVKGTITSYENHVEFVPDSGYHVAPLSVGNPLPEPETLTFDEIVAAGYEKVGDLVTLTGLRITNKNPDDPETLWPAYGNKAKDITIEEVTGKGPQFNLRIYPGSGIPGSPEPAEGFSLTGVLFRELDTYGLFLRQIEDVNPTAERLVGLVDVSVYDTDRVVTVDLSTLPAGLNILEDGEDPVPVVSLASVIQAAALTLNPRTMDYKPVAYDGRQPFETQGLDIMKSGVLFQDEPGDGEPDPMVSSHFWEGVGLSAIYDLGGVTDLFAYRQTEPPQQGEAVHGEGVTLRINGDSWPVNFADLEVQNDGGEDFVPLGALLPDNIMSLYTMDGSFTLEQIKVLYDVRVASYDRSGQVLVTKDEFEAGRLVLSDPPTTDGLPTEVADAYWIEMVRYIDVETADGTTRIYLEDLETFDVDDGEGNTVPAVMFGDVLEAAGVTGEDLSPLNDYNLVASDDFVTLFPWSHNHLEDMYFIPNLNRGYTLDPDLGEYGGRVSTKAIQVIQQVAVPQAPPSIQVDYAGWSAPRWGTDANGCNGCHKKRGEVVIPIDCMTCHTAP